MQSHLADHIVHEIGFHGGLQRFQGAAHQIRQRSLEIHCAAVQPSSGELQGAPTGAGGAVFAGLAAAGSALGNTAAAATAAGAESGIACCGGSFARVQSGVHFIVVADRREQVENGRSAFVCLFIVRSRMHQLYFHCELDCCMPRLRVSVATDIYLSVWILR